MKEDDIPVSRSELVILHVDNADDVEDNNWRTRYSLILDASNNADRSAAAAAAAEKKKASPSKKRGARAVVVRRTPMIYDDDDDDAVGASAPAGKNLKKPKPDAPKLSGAAGSSGSRRPPMPVVEDSESDT